VTDQDGMWPKLLAHRGLVYGTYGRLDTLVCCHGSSVDRKMRVAPVGGNECGLAVVMRGRLDIGGWTLGLIRGLTRYPNPSSKILACYPFLDVSWRSLCLCPSVSTLRRCT